MNDHFLPFASPDLGEEEIDQVVETLRSGWLTTGPKTREFEEKFAAYLGGNIHAIAVNSATAGLHLAIEALGIREGDEVITSTHTFTATAEVARYVGADVRFVDIEPDTLNLDPRAVEAAVTPRTKAIIPVHFGGLTANMERLRTIGERYAISVVEDAAHAFPSTYGGALIGTLKTAATVFSFYANKTMTTGEGGMLVTASAELAERARVMRLHGISRDAFDRFVSKRPSWFYEVVAPGFKYNMTDIAAAIGICQLKKADDFRVKREAIAARYAEALAELPITLPVAASSGDLHSWHLFVIRLCAESKVDRDTFIQRMYDEGVGCSVHYVPLHLHPYWRDRYSLSPEMFPISQKIFENAISLPIYSKMSSDDVEKVISAVKKSLGV